MMKKRKKLSPPNRNKKFSQLKKKVRRIISVRKFSFFFKNKLSLVNYLQSKKLKSESIYKNIILTDLYQNDKVDSLEYNIINSIN
jgi:hypothetical protein